MTRKEWLEREIDMLYYKSLFNDLSEHEQIHFEEYKSELLVIDNTERGKREAERGGE